MLVLTCCIIFASLMRLSVCNEVGICNLNGSVNEFVYIEYLKRMVPLHIPLPNMKFVMQELLILSDRSAKEKVREIIEENKKLNRDLTPEGGTDIKEFLEEVKLTHDANRRAQVQKKSFSYICQTGLNTGFSALAFLCSTPANVILQSFDLGAHIYISKVIPLIEELFPGRHRVILGDSTVTLPAARSNTSCDFVFVDGGHTYDVALNDIVNFHAMAPKGAMIAVENCNCWNLAHGHGGMQSVNEAYLKAVSMGLLTHEKQISTGNCIGKSQMEDCREICVGSVQK